MPAVTIKGETFEVADRYAEGHTLTAAEARHLNQLRRENIRNNQAKFVAEKQANGGLSQEDTAKVLEYANAYEFSMPGAGGTQRVVDPVEREARSMAKEAIKAYLQKNGRKVKDVDAEAYEAEVERIAADAEVLKEAKKRVAAKQKQGAQLAGGISL